jgi:hypothetical protein
VALTPSIIEKVAQAFAATLAGVTVGNGYQLTISPVVRPLQSQTDEDPWTPAHLTAVVEQDDPEEIPTSVGKKRWRIVFRASTYIAPAAADESFDAWLNAVVADVSKALRATDYLGDATLSGHLIARKVRPWWRFSDTGGAEGVAIELETEIEHDADDPYN